MSRNKGYDQAAAGVLAEIGASLDHAQAEIDKARRMIAELGGSGAEGSDADAADLAAIRESRARLARGEEELLPGELVARLAAGESSLRVFREHRGMTQGQLAAAIGVKQSFISKIEAGTKHPTAANLARLARALAIDAELLLPDPD